MPSYKNNASKSIRLQYEADARERFGLWGQDVDLYVTVMSRMDEIEAHACFPDLPRDQDAEYQSLRTMYENLMRRSPNMRRFASKERRRKSMAGQFRVYYSVPGSANHARRFVHLDRTIHGHARSAYSEPASRARFMADALKSTRQLKAR